MEYLSHPSGFEDEGEIAYVSAEFWLNEHDRLDPSKSGLPETFDKLLAYQKGWKACKDFYKIDV